MQVKWLTPASEEQLRNERRKNKGSGRQKRPRKQEPSGCRRSSRGKKSAEELEADQAEEKRDISQSASAEALACPCAEAPPVPVERQALNHDQLKQVSWRMQDRVDYTVIVPKCWIVAAFDKNGFTVKQNLKQWHIKKYFQRARRICEAYDMMDGQPDQQVSDSESEGADSNCCVSDDCSD